MTSLLRLGPLALPPKSEVRCSEYRAHNVWRCAPILADEPAGGAKR